MVLTEQILQYTKPLETGATIKRTTMDNQTAFERICGNCAGVDMASITDQDIKNQAQSFVDSGELNAEEAEDLIESAICFMVGVRINEALMEDGIIIEPENMDQY